MENNKLDKEIKKMNMQAFIALAFFTLSGHVGVFIVGNEFVWKLYGLSLGLITLIFLLVIFKRS